MARRTGLLGITCLLLLRGFYAQPVTYDQRQEGKVNVQVDVKDLQIVALVGSDMLDDFSYDYAYDYSDFTVKPSARPTTSKPSSSKKPTLGGESSSAPSESSSSSTAVDAPTTKAPEEPRSTANSSATEIERIETTTSTSTLNSELSPKRPLDTAEPRKRCPTGFQMRSGRCFKRRHSLISPRLALMKLAPVLLAKSQLLNGHFTTGSS